MPAQDHPLLDNSGSTERLVKKFFIFTSVADADTFACPMADVKYAAFFPNGNAPVSTSVEIGVSSGGVTPLTFQLSATTGGTLEVTGTGV